MNIIQEVLRNRGQAPWSVPFSIHRGTASILQFPVSPGHLSCTLPGVDVSFEVVRLALASSFLKPYVPFRDDVCETNPVTGVEQYVHLGKLEKTDPYSKSRPGRG